MVHLCPTSLKLQLSCCPVVLLYCTVVLLFETMTVKHQLSLLLLSCSPLFSDGALLAKETDEPDVSQHFEGNEED